MNGGRKMDKKTAITIFGGTGDLTFRKLLPALYNMNLTGKLPENIQIIIIGRREYTTASYHEIARQWVQKFSRLPYQDVDFDRFAEKIMYYQMDFLNEEAYEGLNQYYQDKEIKSHIFYFAVAPRFFGIIAHGLVWVENAKNGKVLIEKPFGESLDSARVLNEELETFFSPEHIYRIDHYLGKEMVRNIQTIRFANPIFTGAWDAKHIQCVQISALEDVGVETRGSYYDHSGALKDMVQNHLFQILSIVAMERPEKFTPEAMHIEQLKVLRSIYPATKKEIPDMLVMGQYEGYRQEPSVNPQSNTETFAALRLFIDNERWEKVPFYIRTGKKAGRREMEVTIVFKQEIEGIEPVVLNIKIQPTEGVYLQFNIKKPGDTDEIVQTKMEFCQSCSIQNRINTPEAYERLLGACIQGERSWFSQWDQIEAGWKYINELRTLYIEKYPIYSYSIGTPGPMESEKLLERFGDHWYQFASLGCE